jgi:hypothetical protein
MLALILFGSLAVCIVAGLFFGLVSAGPQGSDGGH